LVVLQVSVSRVLFIMTRRPPGRTLVPYTTLFRSEPLSRPPDEQRARALVREAQHQGRLELSPEEVLELLACFQIPVRLVDTEPEDRKSTRLNSSHVKISYAVFCLKKKR